MADWQERHDDAARHMLPFLERVFGLRDRRVLEFGTGAGPISLALAPHVRSVSGLDIEAGDVAAGRRRLTEGGVQNVELHADAFEWLLAMTRERADEIDRFLLFAVLEHKTLEERHAVLALAREVLRAGGSIAIFETPNRLLADPACLSRRGRWRGASQDELEPALGPLDEQIVAGGYGTRAVSDPTRASRRLYLARFGARAGSAALARVLALLARPRAALRWYPARPARPAMAVRNPRSPGVTITPWESVHCEADARLELPAAGATKLHLGIEQRPGGSELAIEHGPDTARMAVPAAERAQYEQVAFGGADAPLRTAAAAGTQLSFIGLRTAPLP